MSKENKNTPASDESVQTAPEAVWEKVDMVEFQIKVSDLTPLDAAVIKKLYNVGDAVPEDEFGYLLLDPEDADTVENTARHGCGCGAFTSLIYYSDTIDFFENARAAILAQLREDVANGLFEERTIFDVVFGMLERKGYIDHGSPLEDEAGISAALYGPIPLELDCGGAATQTVDLLAWYAAESTCYKLDDNDGYAKTTGEYWHNTKTDEYISIDPREENPKPPTDCGEEGESAAESDNK